MRYFLQIAYLGTNYHGWQVQPNAVTVQEVVQKSLTTILRIETDCVGCGRTDTGVHSKQFYLHFDFESSLTEEKFIHQLNGVLPRDISARRLIKVEDSAHSRFDATKRTYVFRIHTFKDPFLNGLSMFYPGKLDVDAMNEAGTYLLTQTDFASFCKTGADSNTTLCDLKECTWKADQSGYILKISANRFLRNMVRAVVGTMIDLGSGKIDMAEFKRIVESKDRKTAGSSADACGLYLTEISYPYIN